MLVLSVLFIVALVVQSRVFFFILDFVTIAVCGIGGALLFVEKKQG